MSALAMTLVRTVVSAVGGRTIPPFTLKGIDAFTLPTSAMVVASRAQTPTR